MRKTGEKSPVFFLCDMVWKVDPDLRHIVIVKRFAVFFKLVCHLCIDSVPAPSWHYFRIQRVSPILQYNAIRSFRLTSYETFCNKQVQFVPKHNCDKMVCRFLFYNICSQHTAALALAHGIFSSGHFLGFSLCD